MMNSFLRDLVAADVRRLIFFHRMKVRASSRRLLRFTGSKREIFRGILSSIAIVAFLTFCLGGILATPALESDLTAEENQYYQIASIPIPAGIVLEAGGPENLPDKRPAGPSRPGGLSFFDR